MMKRPLVNGSLSLMPQWVLTHSIYQPPTRLDHEHFPKKGPCFLKLQFSVYAFFFSCNTHFPVPAKNPV